MNRQEQVLLYYINSHTDVAGDFVVGRNDVASLLNVSVVTAAKRLEPLVKNGVIGEWKKPLARGAGYKWIYHITQKGVGTCHSQWQDCYRAYTEHIEFRKLEALDEIRKLSKPRGKAIKRAPEQLVLL